MKQCMLHTSLSRGVELTESPEDSLLVIIMKNLQIDLTDLYFVLEKFNIVIV